MEKSLTPWARSRKEPNSLYRGCELTMQLHMQLELTTGFSLKKLSSTWARCFVLTNSVAHHARLDLKHVIARTALKMRYDSPALRKLLATPRFRTMRCAYNKMALGSGPGMAMLYEHSPGPLEGAHDAGVDSAALANCVAEALRRGDMF